MNKRGPFRIVTDVRYSRRYRHHQLLNGDWEVLFQDKNLANLLRWAYHEGIKEIEIMPHPYDVSHSHTVVARANIESRPTNEVYSDG